MFEMLINFIFWIINGVYNITFAPILNIVTGIFPELDTLIGNVQWFLATYVFPTLQWTKMFLINTLAFPRELFTLLTGLFVVLVAVHGVLTVFEGALRLYNHFKP